MKKAAIIFGLLFIFIFTGRTNAQYVRGDSIPRQNKPAKPFNFWDHVSVGGNFGLQFGTYTFVALSPLLDYHFNSHFIVGAGPIYQYYKYQDPTYNYVYTSSVYGGRVVAFGYLPGNLSNVFAMGEYDVINVPYINYLLNENTRMTVGIPLLGGGYRQPIGVRTYFTLAGLWALSNSQYYTYQNPVILAGFDIGI